MLHKRLILAGLAAGAALGGSAHAVSAQTPSYGPPLPGRDCFQSRDWEGWSAPNETTLYLDVKGNFYRVEVLPTASNIDGPGRVLVNRSGGTGTVCRAQDLQLDVVDRQTGFHQPLFPVAIAKLSAAEAQAIPQKDRPGLLRAQ